MKHVIGVVALVALLILSAILVVGLTGTGGFRLLAAAPTPQNSAYTAGNSGDGGLTFSVYFGEADQNGYYTSDYNPQGNSTPIEVGVRISSSGPCNDIYTWVSAMGADVFATNAFNGNTEYTNQPYASWFTVQVLNGETGQPETIGGSGSSTLTLNFSQPTPAVYASGPYSAFCWPQVSSSLTESAVYLAQTFSLQGQYTDFSLLTVTFHSNAADCNGNTGSSAAAGQTAANTGAICTVATGKSGNAGTVKDGSTYYNVVASGQAILRSGYSTLYPPTQGYCINGQTCPIGYSTGYDGAAGFTIEMTYPSVRPNGGTVALGPYTLSQNQEGTYNFQIPSGLSSLPPQPCQGTSSSVGCDWNQFQVWLFSGLFPTSAIWRQPIDISQASIPGLPQVTVTDVQGHSPYRQNDTLSLTFTSTATNSSGLVTAFNVAGYYNAGESVPPVSGQYWIGGATNGQTLSVHQSGNTSTSYPPFTFVIGFDATITVIVQAITAGGQTNQITINLQVVPDNCQTANCQQPTPDLLLIEILVFVIIALAAALIVVFVPMPLWLRIVVVVAAAAGALTFYFVVVPLVFVT